MSRILTVNELKDNYLSVVDRAKEAAKKADRDFNSIKIVAVSKTHPVEMLENALEAGIERFGENYVQELDEKYAHFSANKEIEWHYIGHLQRNKAKNLAPYVHYIHAVDSERLINELEKRAKAAERTLNILLQANTSCEDSKYGADPSAVPDLYAAAAVKTHLNVIGLMTIGTFTDSEAQQRKEFSLLRSLKEKINAAEPAKPLTELSMGMTHDFETAIDEGATIIRVGTAVFGEREYKK